MLTMASGCKSCAATPEGVTNQLDPLRTDRLPVLPRLRPVASSCNAALHISMRNGLSRTPDRVCQRPTQA